MNKYEEFRKRQQEEFNKFPTAFAFSNQQLKEGLEKLGLTENDKDKIIAIGGGGFIKKGDKEAYIKLINKQKNEFNDAIKNDATGENFIKDMFESELANHEYGYTEKLNDTLLALDLTIEDINENENLKNGLNLALNRYLCREDEEEIEG